MANLVNFRGKTVDLDLLRKGCGDYRRRRLVTGRKVTLWRWPDSQICLDCGQSWRLDVGEGEACMDAICSLNVKEREPGSCLKQVRLEPVDLPEHPGASAVG